MSYYIVVLEQKSRKLKACKIHLPQTTRQIDKGTERERNLGKYFVLKDF